MIGEGLEAHSRSTDPATSAIAASLVKANRSACLRARILRILDRVGPLSDEMLDYECNPPAIARGSTSPSGMRTRRAELVGLGLVERHSIGQSRSGRPCTVWCITQAGREALADLSNH